MVFASRRLSKDGMMEAQIVGGLGHQGIERRIAGEACAPFPAAASRPPLDDLHPPSLLRSI
jgi:hypothetical protein